MWIGRFPAALIVEIGDGVEGLGTLETLGFGELHGFMPALWDGCESVFRFTFPVDEMLRSE